MKTLWNKYNISLFIIQIALFCSLLVLCYSDDLYSLSPGKIVNIVLDIATIVVFMMMFISSIRTKIPNKMLVIFMSMIVTATLLSYIDAVCFFVDGKINLRYANIILKTLYYLFTVLLANLYWRFLCAVINMPSKHIKKVTAVVDSLSIVASVLIIGNIFSDYYFTVTQEGNYVRGYAYPASVICPTLILLISAVYICMQKIKLIDKIILIAYPLLPYISAIFSVGSNQPSFICAFSACSLFFVYCSIYVDREYLLYEKEAELAQSNINSMLLQINPHFIYNTLGSVSGLCREDPEKAEELLSLFSGYLRNNFGEMAHQSLVPFEKEIEHLKLYTDIEKMRFPDITVVTDYRATDFMLPPLSVQPIAENAVKHGLLGRESGGTLKISSFESDKFYHIVVVDDGVGFKDVPKNDGKNHIGIKNVKSRLEILCGGTLNITSSLGRGTVAEIKIPKQKQKNKEK